MSPADRQFIYQPVPAGHREFIEFWAPRYGFSNETDYTDNIRGPHTPESLRLMFRWKLGGARAAWAPAPPNRVLVLVLIKGAGWPLPSGRGGRLLPHQRASGEGA
jgi:hypothetical protein